MTIKHGAHTFNIDPATTDTYRHYHEGNAERVAMVAPDKFALIARWGDEVSAEDVAERHMSDADIVLCEGFKRSGLPKIEIHRKEAHPAPLYGTPAVETSTYCAMVTDADLEVQGVKVIRLESQDWLDSLAGFVERTIMNRR